LLKQTNLGSGKVRQLRRAGGLPSPRPEEPPPSAAAPSRAPAVPGGKALDTGQERNRAASADECCVEVWLAGEWKRLGKEESSMISKKRAAGAQVFEISSRSFAYRIDLSQMTQTNLQSGRTRTIRFAEREAKSSMFGFDEFREGFRRHAPSGKLQEQELVKSWPASHGTDQDLVQATVRAVLKEMDLRRNNTVDMMEWNHYWALERDSPSFHAGNEVNVKLAEALRRDPQVLGRMQMHFETAVGEDAGRSGCLSSEGLLRACQRLVASPKTVLEKQWAQEVLQKHKTGDGVDEDAQLSYYDFLNVMLGRKRFKVSIWMYDISDGMAARWSSLLVGQHFEGIWHSGIVVEWPERSSEFWFGGSLFESDPGSTPFGRPLERRPLGHTYKLREEVWDHLNRHLASEFTRDKYDVLTHNCNHFSEKLSMFLRNDHIPDEVLHQPDMVMAKPLPRLLRPVLNRWLGGFASEDGRATDGGEALRKMWQAVLPGALVEFSKEEGGRPLVGLVEAAYDQDCVVRYLDFWSQSAEERPIPAAQVTQVLRDAPRGAVRQLKPTPGRGPQPDCPFVSWFKGTCLLPALSSERRL